MDALFSTDFLKNASMSGNKRFLNKKPMKNLIFRQILSDLRFLKIMSKHTLFVVVYLFFVDDMML